MNGALSHRGNSLNDNALFLFIGGFMKELLEKILAEIKKTPGGMTAYEDLYHICIETKKTDTELSVKYLKLLSDSDRKSTRLNSSH